MQEVEKWRCQAIAWMAMSLMSSDPFVIKWMSNLSDEASRLADELESEAHEKALPDCC